MGKSIITIERKIGVKRDSEEFNKMTKALRMLHELMVIDRVSIKHDNNSCLVQIRIDD